MRYAKGNYFAIKTRAPFSRLIYPVPEPGGLGIHMTLDLSGHARFGPDVEWIEELDYDVGQDRVEKFYPAIRSYWPDLADGALLPAYSGIRPKLSGPGEPEADFIISGPRDHGMPGVINLFGIESPGLTASMALGRRVAMVAGGEL
jgi:L-2-hydroxyglutarate oxidase LhgO